MDRILVLVALLAFALPAYGTATFVPLPNPPGMGAFAFGISADGSVVVGFTVGTACCGEAFRWTSAGGMVGLGDLAGGSFGSSADATSADGSVIVGQGRSASGLEAFRWTSEGGMVGLGDLAGGSFNSSAHGVSGDGSVVVGYGNWSASGAEAFRWTSDGGMLGLGYLADGDYYSDARAVSADGSVVVGFSLSVPGVAAEAFRWTSEGGMVGLGDLPGGDFHSGASAVSPDGSVIVGGSTSASGSEAFRWTSEGGMVGLGDLPGGAFQSGASAVSADGSVIVGTGTIGEPGLDSEPAAFIWDPINGMRDLRDVLVSDYGLDLTGWTLDEATGISADGKIIVGNSNGRAWLVALPEPGTALLVMVGLLGLGAAGRKRSARRVSS